MLGQLLRLIVLIVLVPIMKIERMGIKNRDKEAKEVA
jgi:hypothetical protein